MKKLKAHLLPAVGFAALITMFAFAAISGQATWKTKLNLMPKLRSPTALSNGARNAVRTAQTEPITFNMIVSAGAAGCLPNATATVTITPAGPVEIMDVNVSNLPPNNDFDFFVLQIPRAPFGIGWYQGDIETDDYGNGSGEFVGRFSIETFSVAQPPGNAPAPVVHDQPPFPDASSNPPFEPIHMYHLGLWFGSVDEAVAAGCPATETRFNGDHTAGIQVLNTGNFPDDQGPLRQIE